MSSRVPFAYIGLNNPEMSVIVHIVIAVYASKTSSYTLGHIKQNMAPGIFYAGKIFTSQSAKKRRQ